MKQRRGHDSRTRSSEHHGNHETTFQVKFTAWKSSALVGNSSQAKPQWSPSLHANRAAIFTNPGFRRQHHTIQSASTCFTHTFSKLHRFSDEELCHLHLAFTPPRHTQRVLRGLTPPFTSATRHER